VSAKLRLGWDSIDQIDRNAEMAALGGASWITIHGRTKTQGYTPPAYWEPIGRVRAQLSIPVIANGEIWTLDDFKRCRDQTQCEHYMLGRGALADPFLALRIRAELRGVPGNLEHEIPWRELFVKFHQICMDQGNRPGHVVRRIKQWVRLASVRHPLQWFEELKRAETFEELLERVPPGSEL
jgi:tRNA-dihydrouridine synthase C